MRKKIDTTVEGIIKGYRTYDGNIIAKLSFDTHHIEIRLIDSKDPRLILLMDIKPLKSYTREFRILNKNGLVSLLDVMMSSPEKIKKIAGIGDGTIMVLNGCLKLYNLWYIEKQTKMFNSETGVISIR